MTTETTETTHATRTAAHTPGPWETSVSRRPRYVEVHTPRGKLLDLTPAGDGEWDDAIADARLIAAAPDLLAAIKQLLASNQYEQWQCPNMDVGTAYEEYLTNSQTLSQARAAIARAEGND